MASHSAVSLFGLRKKGASSEKNKDGDYETSRGRPVLYLVLLAQVLLLLFWALSSKLFKGALLFQLARLDGSHAEDGSMDDCGMSTSRWQSSPTFDVCQLDTVGGGPRNRYGSWPICSNQVPPNCTVFSFGIGGDVSFDIEMIKRGCTVFGFDPTVPPENATALFQGADAPFAESFHFMQVGLGAFNGVVPFMSPKDKRVKSMTSLSAKDAAMWRYQSPTFHAAVLTLPTLMAATKQGQLDVLKIDVEGIEFDVCESAEFLHALSRVGQVLFEFHERMLQNPDNRKARCNHLLRSQGFTEVKRTRHDEFAFARMAPNAKLIEK